MQQINKEVISFLEQYDTNFATTARELENTQTDLKKFQILFNKMASVAEGSFNRTIVEKAQGLVQKAHQSSSLDSRCLLTIAKTFDTISYSLELVSRQEEQDFNNLLKTWNAPEAVKLKVQNCRKNKEERLDLNECNLDSFPSALLKHLPHLKHLDLAFNQLTSFSLEGASQLKTLDLGSNRLTSFSLEGASQLKTLDLGSNSLTSFSLEGASQLKTLSLIRNRLSSFRLEGALQLENLLLAFNELTSFTLEGTSQLEILLLEFNELTSFTLEGASQLEILYLANNRLNQQPLLRNCARPQIFNVSGNPYLENININKNSLEQRLAFFTKQLQGSTPEINALKKLSVDVLYEVFEPVIPTLIPQINLWLEKLQTAKDFENVRNKQEFAYNVLSILDFALKTEEFREPLRLSLQTANSSCVDRCSLFLNEAVEAKKIYELGVMSVSDAVAFLKGSYALTRIHALATEFVESKRIPCDPNRYYSPDEVINVNGVLYRDTVDPIEVYIDLQCKLKDDFSLPVAIKQQNYKSSVTPELELRVRENVRRDLKNIEALTTYFCEFPAWVEKIKKEYGRELEPVLDKINEEMEEIIASEAFIKLNADGDKQKAMLLPYQKKEREVEKEFIIKKTQELLHKGI